MKGFYDVFTKCGRFFNYKEKFTLCLIFLLGGLLASCGGDEGSSGATFPPVSILSVEADNSKLNALEFVVKYNRNVSVDTTEGTPRISFVVDNTTKYATYQSGTGSPNIIFRYGIEVGELYQGGLTVASIIDLNGGSINDAENKSSASLEFTPPSNLPNAIAYETIYSNDCAFTKIKKDGQVATWGSVICGGNAGEVAKELSLGVIKIFSTKTAFAALKDDGSVVTWGSSTNGGDSTSVASYLTSGVNKIFSTASSFASLKDDGSVVTWGSSTNGGDSTSVASYLTSGVSKIFSTDSAFAALS